MEGRPQGISDAVGEGRGGIQDRNGSGAQSRGSGWQRKLDLIFPVSSLLVVSQASGQ